MIRLGELSLLLAFLVGILGFLTSVSGVITRRKRAADSARRLSYLNFVLISLSTFALVYAFLQDQFQLEYVAGHSNRAMPTVYKISALWGGMEGSLLLWAFVLAIFSVIFAISCRNKWRFSYVSGSFLALFLVQIFFLLLLNFASDPFVRITAPADGQGLNPLLQNPGMALHPPLLYLGFVGLTIPFAQAMGSLLSGHLDDHWLEDARKWTLVAWIILGVGIMRGGLWAYQELGWGGYWAWDPVENASFMPWLLATAFIHSIMIQKHRGMLKVWNVFLALLAFAFTILGTFLTRSGVISSVHTFALNETLGYTFLGFLGLLIGGGILLIILRWNKLEAQHSLDSFLSREFMFVLNNLVLVGITFVICWGTLFPVLSEWLTGEKQSVGPPYFNMVTIPLFLLLILVTGIGSLIGWRKASWRNLKRNFSIPLIGFLLSLYPFWYLVQEHAVAIKKMPEGLSKELSFWYCTLAFALTVFTAITMLQEFFRGTASRMNRFGENAARAFITLFRKNKRRYGGYLSHIGLLVVVVGIATSSAFRSEVVKSVEVGSRVNVAGYEFSYTGLESFQIPLPPRDHVNARVWQANLWYRTPGGHEGYLLPQIRQYHRQPRQPFTEVARDIRWSGDLYVVISGLPGEGSGTVFTFFYNPLVGLVWFGVLWMAGGGIIALVPFPKISTPRNEKA